MISHTCTSPVLSKCVRTICLGWHTFVNISCLWCVINSTVPQSSDHRAGNGEISSRERVFRSKLLSLYLHAYITITRPLVPVEEQWRLECIHLNQQHKLLFQRRYPRSFRCTRSICRILPLSSLLTVLYVERTQRRQLRAQEESTSGHVEDLPIEQASQQGRSRLEKVRHRSPRKFVESRKGFEGSRFVEGN